MDLVVGPRGTIRTIYAEAVDLTQFGRPIIQRASDVEPDEQGRWRADLRPVLGPVLGPFAHRSAAIQAETAWLNAHWLTTSRPAASSS